MRRNGSGQEQIRRAAAEDWIGGDSKRLNERNPRTERNRSKPLQKTNRTDDAREETAEEKQQGDGWKTLPRRRSGRGGGIRPGAEPESGGGGLDRQKRQASP